MRLGRLTGVTIPLPEAPVVADHGLHRSRCRDRHQGAEDAQERGADQDRHDHYQRVQLDGTPVYGRLEQVVMNLAVNAKDAMPRGGKLSISLANTTINKATDVRPAGDYVWIKVADTGSGIPPEILNRIFDPFFTTKAAGTGLGLSVVKRVVEAHRGEIALASVPGEGSTFTLRLPIA